MKTYNKLIRDKIPEIIEASGKTCKTYVLSAEAFKSELKKKVVEEAIELQNATTKKDIIEEVADIYEILDYIKSLHNIDEETIRLKQNSKNEDRGKFDKRIFLELVE